MTRKNVDAIMSGFSIHHIVTPEKNAKGRARRPSRFDDSFSSEEEEEKESEVDIDISESARTIKVES